MRSNHIGTGAAVARSEHRMRQDDQDQQTAFTALKSNASISRESFISSVVADRQPPRLPLDDVIPKMPSAATALFGIEIESLAKKSGAQIAGDIAGIYLSYAKDAKNNGDPNIVSAFEYLGETMVNYEHLRLLRTGQLG